MIVLDIIANNNWERPIYFSSVNTDADVGLAEFMQLDGFAYRLVPIRSKPQNRLEPGRIISDSLYKRLMVQFDWKNMGDPNQFVSYDIKRNVQVVDTRNIFVRLARQLFSEGDSARCIEVIEKSLRLMPHPQYEYDFATLYQIDLLYDARASRVADSLLTQFLDYEEQYQQYFNSLSSSKINLLTYDISRHLSMLQALASLGEKSHDINITARCNAINSFFSGSSNQ
jgi:membrane protein